MNRLTLAAATLGALALGACAYPTSTVEQGLAPGRFRISDAPQGATILIDGRVVGQRSAQPSDIFPVEPGTHTVEERFGDRILLHKTYSVDAGSSVEVGGV